MFALAIAMPLGGAIATRMMPVAAQDAGVAVATAPAPEQPVIAPTEPLPPPAPTETPVIVPTSIPAEPTTPPTIAPTALPEPTATATPSPTPTPVTVPDELTCIPAQGRWVDNRWQSESTCTYRVNGDRAATRIAVQLAPGSPAGWTIQLQAPGAAPAWGPAGERAEFTDERTATAGGSFTFSVRLIAPAGAPAGQVASADLVSEIVRAENGSPFTMPGITQRLSVTVPAPPVTPTPAPTPTPTPAPRMGVAMIVEQPNPSALSCTEPNGDKVQPGKTITYQCSFSVRYGSSGNLETIFTGSITSGWTVGMTGIFGGTTYSSPTGAGPVEMRVSASSALSGTLTISVKAPAGAALGSTGTFSLTTDCTVPGACKTAAEKPSAKIVTTVVSSACSSPVTASLTGSTLPPVSYSLTARTNTGSATLQVGNPGGCTGWSVSISGTDFRYSGVAPNQASLPVGNLRVTAPGKTALQLSAQAKALITGGPADASPSYPLTLALDIPGGSAAGTYTSTITVSTAAAPG
jgi:hypothetical protein